ncbi:MAG: bacteriohemerythrin [Fusobacteriota bacterium]
MIWRKKFEIGVEKIDKQHKELFERVFSFLEVVRGDYDKAAKYERLEETLSFMSKYVVIHFDSEEKLQRTCNYPDYKKHHEIHEGFKDGVEKFKDDFKKGKITEDDIQKFSGRLLAWLINHVVREDQKIANFLGNVEEEVVLQIDRENIDIIKESTRKILNSMLQLDSKKVDKEGILLEKRVIGSIGIYGDINGKIYFSMSKDFAINAVKKMAAMDLEKVDSFVKSAIGELVNIISANVLSEFNKSKKICDITPPDVFVGRDAEEILNENYDTIYINTDLGEIKISSDVE